MVKIFDWIFIVSIAGAILVLLIAEFHSFSLAIGLLTGIVLMTGLQILDTLWKQEKT